MRRVGWIVSGLVLGLSALAGLSPAAAYPDIECHITDPGRACEGEPLRLSATVDPAVNCTRIWITWKGMTREGTGPSLVATFPTEVGDADRPSLRSDVASCTYVDAQGVSQTISTRGTVIIDECPDNDGRNSDDDDDDGDDDDNGSLPDTGGERLLWLVLGALLLIGGGVTVLSSRREDEAGGQA